MSMADEGIFPDVVYLLYRVEDDESDERLISCHANYPEASRARDSVFEEFDISREQLVIAVQGIGDVQWTEGFITLRD